MPFCSNVDELNRLNAKVVAKLLKMETNWQGNMQYQDIIWKRACNTDRYFNPEIIIIGSIFSRSKIYYGHCQESHRKRMP